jgi:hypothetical protein
MNWMSIGIELTGKHKKDPEYKGHTNQQKQSLRMLIQDLEKDYDLLPFGDGYNVIPQSKKLRRSKNPVRNVNTLKKNMQESWLMPQQKEAGRILGLILCLL